MTDGDLEGTIRELRAAEDLPEAGDDLAFEAPWQARAFAVVVTLYRQGSFEWNEFQARLIDRVQSEEPAVDPENAEGTYYRHWIGAAEDLLREKGIVDDDELAGRVDEFVAGERDASEFTVGVEHAHTHTHAHGHDHDHDHGHGHGHDHGHDRGDGG